MDESFSKFERTALLALWGFSLIAIAGFASFGLNPQLLARFPSVAWMYGYAFEFFAVGQVWIAWAVLVLFLGMRVGVRWLPAFFATYLLSLGSELAGTTFGFPFGAYEYTALMEPQWFGRVPIVIPLSWFYMSVASYALAGRVLGQGTSKVMQRIVLAAAALTAWDLALDPAMSAATRYWTWESTGAYYGMPWINLAGWFFTGLLLMGALALLRSERWLDALPDRWFASYYSANMILPIGMSAAAGLWIAAVLGLAVLAIGWVLLGRSSGAMRSSAPSRVRDRAGAVT